MAVGLKATVANSLLNALLRNTSYAGPAALYMQLHTAAPGATGSSNIATNTTRQAVTFAASSAGTIATATDVSWTNVPASEDYAFFTLWDASTSGNFILSGALTANSVTAGDTFTISAGAETGTFNLAS